MLIVLWPLWAIGSRSRAWYYNSQGGRDRRAEKINALRARAGIYRVAFPFCLFYVKYDLTNLSLSLFLSRARHTHTHTHTHIHTYIHTQLYTRRFEVRGGEVTGQLRAKLNVYRQSGDTFYYLFFVFSALPDHLVYDSPPFPFSCPTVF